MDDPRSHISHSSCTCFHLVHTVVYMYMIIETLRLKCYYLKWWCHHPTQLYSSFVSYLVCKWHKAKRTQRAGLLSECRTFWGTGQAPKVSIGLCPEFVLLPSMCLYVLPYTVLSLQWLWRSEPMTMYECTIPRCFCLEWRSGPTNRGIYFKGLDPEVTRSTFWSICLLQS